MYNEKGETLKIIIDNRVEKIKLAVVEKMRRKFQKEKELPPPVKKAMAK